MPSRPALEIKRTFASRSIDDGGVPADAFRPLDAQAS
jgi:hypothetical protein